MDESREPRFLCDAMVGRLARRLRMLGYDAAYQRKGTDRELLRRAARERRTVITRDTGIPVSREGVRVLHLRANDVAGQLRDVVATLALDKPPGLFRRCLECNAVLREARPAEVAAKVPPYVRTVCEEFRACPLCRRVYWPGTHRREMLRSLEGLFPVSAAWPCTCRTSAGGDRRPDAGCRPGTASSER